MKSICIFLILLFSNPAFCDEWNNALDLWEADMIDVYDSRTARNSTFIKEYLSFVHKRQVTINLIEIGKRDGYSPKTLLGQLRNRKWKSREADFYFPYIICDIFDIRAGVILGLTGGDETKLDILLEGIYGIRSITSKEIQFMSKPVTEITKVPGINE